jgi:hypothetical protein
MKRPLPNLLTHGFWLALRNWPCVVWAYGVNLAFGLLAAIPFAGGLAPYLDHSLAAQKIAGTIDLGYLLELETHLRESNFIAVATQTAFWLNLLEVLVFFVLFTGTIFVYVSAEPPRLSVLLRGGVAYFWRFVRAACVAVCIAGLILGVLIAGRAALLARASAVYVERKMFLYSVISGAVVLLAALLVRLWLDLVEVYIVRNAVDGERRVRNALLPALRLLYRYFFRTVGSFLLTGMLGVSALAACLYLWKEFVPAYQVWIGFLLAQVGLFLLLASRFWQRGIEVSLAMAADPPNVAVDEVVEIAEEDIPVVAGAEAFAGLSEPTLRDLVQKLRTEPWANPEAVLGSQTSRSLQPARPVDPEQGNEPEISLLDRHTKKFPLGGLTSDEQGAPANSAESSRSSGDQDIAPETGKKP